MNRNVPLIYGFLFALVLTVSGWTSHPLSPDADSPAAIPGSHAWVFGFAALAAAVLFAVALVGHRRARRALREREQQLRLFVEHSPAAIAMLDRNLHYLFVSRRWLTDYHLQERNIIGRSHYDVFPDLPEAWKEVHQRCLGGAVEASDGDPFPRADGSLDWVRWEIRPWHTGPGDIGGIVVFSEVITEHKQHEREIDRLKRLYATLSQVNQAIVRADSREELFKSVCRVAVEFGKFRFAWLGWEDSREAHLQCIAWDSPPGGLREPPPGVALGCGITAAARQTGRTVFSNQTASDARTCVCHAAAGTADLGSCAAIPIRFQGRARGILEICSAETDFFNPEEIRLLEEVALDISCAVDRLHEQEEHRQSEEAVRTSKAKLDAALASMADAVFICDAEGRFVDFNEACATFHKFANKTECPRTLAEYAHSLELFWPDGKAVPLDQWPIPCALRGESAANVEYTVRRKDTGATWTGSYSFAPVRSPSGAMTGAVIVFRDTTERRRMEETLRSSEERFRAFVEQAADALFVHDFAGRFLAVNQQACTSLGYSAKEASLKAGSDM